MLTSWRTSRITQATVLYCEQFVDSQDCQCCVHDVAGLPFIIALRILELAGIWRPAHKVPWRFIEIFLARNSYTQERDKSVVASGVNNYGVASSSSCSKSICKTELGIRRIRGPGRLLPPFKGEQFERRPPLKVEFLFVHPVPSDILDHTPLWLDDWVKRNQGLGEGHSFALFRTQAA